MGAEKPTKIVLAYEDGTTRETDFASLPGTLQFDILRQHFLLDPAAAAAGGAGSFLLAEWKDGWKEVYEVDRSCTGINRYYGLSRVEEVGRLSLTASEGYPELLELTRRPNQVVRIAFGESFSLDKDLEKREGRKTEQFYTLKAAGDAFAAEVAALRALAAAEGIDLAAGLQLRGDELLGWLDGLRRKLGIVAGQRQQDVLDFTGYLATEAIKG
jgi:hypothetical protein